MKRRKQENCNTTPSLSQRLPSLLQYQNRSPTRMGHSHLFPIGDWHIGFHVQMPAIVVGTFFQDMSLLIATFATNNVRVTRGCCVIG